MTDKAVRVAKKRLRIRLPDPSIGSLGGILPGEIRNPSGKGGFGEEITPERASARYRAGFKPHNNANPYGVKGFEPYGVKKVDTKRRPAEVESLIRDVREIRDQCRTIIPEAIEVLANILRNPAASDMAKIAAYHALADRGYGKPTQTNVTANVDADSKPSEINANELDARIAETLKRVERIAGGEVEAIDSQEQPPDIRKRH